MEKNNMRTIKEILMDRDGYSEQEAIEEIQSAMVDLEDRIHDPDTYGDPYDICMDWFGLEPDYIDELF
jgi:hypothetical protein